MLSKEVVDRAGRCTVVYRYDTTGSLVQVVLPVVSTVPIYSIGPAVSTS
jgi:hypothetical protein